MPVPRALIALSFPLALASCGDPDVSESARFPSPVGEIDAVVGQMKAGESEPYLVVLTRTGAKPHTGTRLLIIDKTEQPPSVAWQDPDHLTISCKGGRIWSFRNFWVAQNNNTVAVALDCGTAGWTDRPAETR